MRTGLPGREHDEQTAVASAGDRLPTPILDPAYRLDNDPLFDYAQGKRYQSKASDPPLLDKDGESQPADIAQYLLGQALKDNRMSEAGAELTQRDVASPSQFTWRNWKRILLRVKNESGKDNISLIAAGIAFYSMLAIFPGIAAFVGIYGLIADPSVVIDQMDTLSGFLPPEALEIIRSQTMKMVEADTGKIGFTALLATLLAIWSTRAGIRALVIGLNIVYNEKDQRGFFSQIGVTLILTIVMLIVATIAVLAIVAVPIILDILSLGEISEWIAAIVRWPIAVGTILVSLAIFYRYGPHRNNPKLKWLSIGAIVATMLWIIGSAAFSIYVANFSSYNETYGSIGAVIGLLMWFYLSAYIVLLGAELNAEMEKETRLDTTTGPDRPPGERGAYAADTVA